MAVGTYAARARFSARSSAVDYFSHAAVKGDGWAGCGDREERRRSRAGRQPLPMMPYRARGRSRRLSCRSVRPRARDNRRGARSESGLKQGGACANVQIRWQRGDCFGCAITIMNETERARILLYAELMRAVSKMDACGALIKKADLLPVREQILRIGHAIGQLYLIEMAIVKEDPRLYPAFFKIKEEHSGTALALAEDEARRAVQEERLDDAIAFLETYLEKYMNDPAEHRTIASDEIVRLRLMKEALQDSVPNASTRR